MTAIAAPTASAVVTEVEGTKVGLQPREESRYWEGDAKLDGTGGIPEANNAVKAFGNNPLHVGQPGPVMHSAATYVIYWDPQDYYHSDWQSLIDEFMANLGSSGGSPDNVFSVDGQYTDGTNQPATTGSIFHGAYVDTNPYPQSEGCIDPHPFRSGMPVLESQVAVCLTDKQVRAQLETFIGEQHGLHKGMGAIFNILTPPGVTVCLDAGGATGHCSDFSGSPTEISDYEANVSTYPERLAKYEKEMPGYEKELEAYEEEKTRLEKEGQTDSAQPPVEPTRPLIPMRPASYESYKRSFCSYHAAVSPTEPVNGDDNTILYAVIPWTAGGAGDYHLSFEDRTQAPACQDGGFQPSTKPGGELEEKEHEKARTRIEQEEFEKKTPTEQREEEEAKELGLEFPHDQEPNQIGLGEDGSYDTGLADLIINQIAVEQQDTVTNPLLNAWQDSAGQEVTDECRNSFFLATGGASAKPLTQAGTLSNQTLADHTYYLNDTFNLAAAKFSSGVPCRGNVALEAKFTAPNPVNSGEIVGFDGMESDITLNSGTGFNQNGTPNPRYATFTWNFGDGSAPITGFAPGSPSANSPAVSPCAAPWEAPCAASTYHSYQYGGTYTVTLTITDVAGTTRSVSKAITVDGPPAPAPEQPLGGGSGTPASTTTAGSSPSSGAAGSPPGATSTVPAPVVTGIATTTSLKKALSKGLPVHYTANEQVAGSIEVLLESSIAKRLGVHGSTATGLPKGTPSSIVVGTAVLVTTKAGQGTLHIKFFEPHFCASEARPQTEADVALVCAQRLPPEPPDDHLAKHGRPQPLTEGSCPSVRRPRRLASSERSTASQRSEPRRVAHGIPGQRWLGDQPTRRIRPAAPGGVEPHAVDVHERVAGVGIDRDPATRPRFTPIGQVAGYERGAQETTRGQGIAHRAGAVVSVGDKRPMPTPPDIGKVGNCVAAGHDPLHRFRYPGGDRNRPVATHREPACHRRKHALLGGTCLSFGMLLFTQLLTYLSV